MQVKVIPSADENVNKFVFDFGDWLRDGNYKAVK